MPRDRYAAFQTVMEEARNAFHAGDLDRCFYLLENAHVLGQDRIRLHTLSHWWMLKVGLKRRFFRDVFGQGFRILASLLFSRLWVPRGNTGGTDVSPFRPMPLRPELAPFFASTDARPQGRT